MKAQIHPQFVETRVVCACGQSFTSASTKPDLHVEVCHKCHPYFTGEHRFIDTQGRVENFQKKQKAAVAYKAQYTGKNSKKNKSKNQESPKSLKELLSEV